VQSFIFSGVFEQTSIPLRYWGVKKQQPTEEA
jgi:hypothetical protein